MEPQDFEDYVWGRAGNGELVYRVSTGKAYDIDSGEMVARLEGIEVARAVRSDADSNTVFHIGRAVLLYRHPVSDVVLEAYPGSDPAAQTLVSAYSYENNALVWRLGIPNADAPPRMLPGGVDCERQGPVLYCLRGSSYDSPAGMSVLEYRWTVDRTAPAIEASSRAEFAETEPPNPAISDGPLLIRLSSYRVSSWATVPPSLREWVEVQAPGFATLPENLPTLIEAAGFTR